MPLLYGVGKPWAKKFSGQLNSDGFLLSNQAEIDVFSGCVAIRFSEDNSFI
jgi:hypothetical protein